MKNNVCKICPRNCEIDKKNCISYCGAKMLKVAKVMRHFWEEPPISDRNGSGAIFFSHCSLKCCYCQNYFISHNGSGKEISIQELANIFKLIEDNGMNNINLVSPTHYTNEIIESLKIYKPKIPIIWNTSGYEKPETIGLLKNYVDIFLCDFKYFDNELALKYSKAPNYFKNCTSSLLEMRKNQPKDVFENGLMKKGLIIRHLVLPTNYEDSLKIVNWINENLGNETILSIMSQFTPCYKAKDFPELNSKLKPIEYKKVILRLKNLNFNNAFVQDSISSSEEFIPDFNLEKFIEI